MLIWVIEDDHSSQFVYEEILGHEHQLLFFEDLASFCAALDSGSERPVLILADLRLRDGTFLSFLDQDGSQEKVRGIPIFVVSSMDDAEVLRTCFKRGTVDYLTKPFSRAELLVKVEKHLALRTEKNLK